MDVALKSPASGYRDNVVGGNVFENSSDNGVRDLRLSDYVVNAWFGIVKKAAQNSTAPQRYNTNCFEERFKCRQRS